MDDRCTRDPTTVADTLRLLALPPDQVRLITATHEAGHAVAAHTLGMTVVGAWLADDGTLDAHVRVEYGYPAGSPERSGLSPVRATNLASPVVAETPVAPRQI